MFTKGREREIAQLIDREIYLGEWMGGQTDGWIDRQTESWVS